MLWLYLFILGFSSSKLSAETFPIDRDFDNVEVRRPRKITQPVEENTDGKAQYQRRNRRPAIEKEPPPSRDQRDSPQDYPTEYPTEYPGEKAQRNRDKDPDNPDSYDLRKLYPANENDDEDEILYRPLIRTHLLGGIASLQNDDTTTNAQREEEGLTRNMTFGLDLEYRFSRNFLGFAEGFFGFYPAQEIERVDASGNSTNEQLSIAHRGLNVDIRYQPALGYPTVFMPFLGVGGGLLTLSQHRTTSSTDVTIEATGKAFFLTLGLEFDFSHKFSLQIDYALPLGATTELTKIDNGTTTTISLGGESKIGRLRLRMMANLTHRLSLGLQYVLRRLELPPLTGGTSSANIDNYHQVLGVLGLSFY